MTVNDFHEELTELRQAGYGEYEICVEDSGEEYISTFYDVKLKIDEQRELIIVEQDYL